MAIFIAECASRELATENMLHSRALNGSQNRATVDWLKFRAIDRHSTQAHRQDDDSCDGTSDKHAGDDAQPHRRNCGDHARQKADDDLGRDEYDSKLSMFTPGSTLPAFQFPARATEILLPAKRQWKRSNGCAGYQAAPTLAGSQ